MSFKVLKDINVNSARVIDVQVLPFINHLTAPEVIPGTGGGIAYDPSTRFVYFNDGFSWVQVQPGGAVLPGTTHTFSLYKNGDLSIPPNTTTILNAWSITPSPPYHDDTGPSWNLSTGVYTSGANQFLYVDADITWKAGVSNLGIRTLEIVYQSGSTTVVKSFETQADPSTAIATTQEASIALQLTPTDSVWVQVRHNAPTPLIIAGGNQTTLCGMRVNPS